MTKLEEARAALAAAEAEAQRDQETKSGFLMKALEVFGGMKVRKGIIGHDAPAEGKKVEPAAFGTNVLDKSDPEGTGSPEMPGEGASPAGAAARIEAARDQARHSDAASGGDIQTKAPQGVSSAALLKGLKDADTDGAVAEALDASPVLAKLTDVLVKGLQDLSEQLTERLDEQDEQIALLGEGQTLIARSQLSAATAEVETPITKSLEVEAVAAPRAIAPGIGVLGGKMPVASDKVPQGLTKSMTVNALMRANADGAIDDGTFAKLSGKVDTVPPEYFWNELPAKVQQLVNETLGL